MAPRSSWGPRLAALRRELLFTCINSKAEKPNQEKGGVGLANVRKRLDLLYDKRYKLDIKDEPDIYTVVLKLPL